MSRHKELKKREANNSIKEAMQARLDQTPTIVLGRRRIGIKALEIVLLVLLKPEFFKSFGTEDDGAGLLEWSACPAGLSTGFSDKWN